MKKRNVQTTPRPRKAATNGKGKPGNTAFTVIEKLHCAEREKRRLQRAYLAKLLKCERIGRIEVRDIDIMHAIAADLRRPRVVSPVDRQGGPGPAPNWMRLTAKRRTYAFDVKTSTSL